jgi:long-chain acyl-CoA synthetase
MKGYHNLEEATAAALTADGWLRTGDIGRVLDSGHLEITDRKREIIVTANGKNIAPALFQNRLKTLSPWIQEVLLHGDRRNFCSALVTIDVDAVGHWADEENITWRDPQDLTTKRAVRALIQQAIDDVNRTLPAYEQVKKFAILPIPFTVKDGTLTPSLKMKRRIIEDKYRHLLDSFYEGAIAHPD